MNTMKAVIQEAYGQPAEVLKVVEIEKPTPKRGEVLLRVRAASVHPDIWNMVVGMPYVFRLMGNGVFKPQKKAPGCDLAGTVEAIGEGVTQFRVGDDVFGETVVFGMNHGGAYAEYAVVQASLLAKKPQNVSFEQAAVVPTSGYIALQNVMPAKPGQNVLINGAGGCVGTLAIQILKARGAGVTAVDCAEKLAMMQGLGADRVVDYAKVNVLTEGERYDFILDVASTWWFDVVEPVLAPGGIYIPIGHSHFGAAKGRMGGKIVGSLPLFIGLLLKALLNPEKRRNLKFLTKQESIATFKELLESGQLTPVIAKTFPLSGAAEALESIQDVTVAGRVVITP
jgi:NADPH:quinone reductase-like Zn-dependent oxidoreductase